MKLTCRLPQPPDAHPKGQHRHRNARLEVLAKTVRRLLLAAVGIYGVMSCAAAQRVHEVGVRMALGARGVNILWLMLRHSLGLTAAGLVTGLAGSLLLTRFLGSMLYDVKSSDPLTFASVALFLAIVAQISSLLPAWRAATVDPVDALRQD